MKDKTFKLIIAFLVIAGGLFNLGVVIWQSITNLLGFWFWISLQSSFAWGMLAALLNDIKWLKNKK